MNKMFVGLDVSKNGYKVCLLDGEGEKICKVFALANNADDSQKLVDIIVKACSGNNIQKVFIGYESTSVYGWHLQYFLADSSALKPFSPSIICFNPKIIDSFKKTLGDLPKTDRIDAFVIAERLRFGRLPDSVPADFYSRKHKESKTHHHKRALVLTARKVVRLVFALLHDEKLYNPRNREMISNN